MGRTRAAVLRVRVARGIADDMAGKVLAI